jgi:hypothetical protein
VAEQLCCSKGHRWAPVQLPPDFRCVCPVCGEAPISPNDVTASRVRLVAILVVIYHIIGLALILSGNTIAICMGVAIFVPDGAWVAIGVGLSVTRQRTKEMARVAEKINFAFMAHFLMGWLCGIAPFRLFTIGWDQKALNALFGRVGDCDIIYFEYQYTTAIGYHAATHRLGVMILPDGAAGAPNFQLTPQTYFDALAGLFTKKRIELEGADVFNRCCKLVGRDEDGLRKTFHPDLVEYLGRDYLWRIEVMNGQMLLHRQSPPRPGKVPSLLLRALEIRDLLRGPQKSNL